MSSSTTAEHPVAPQGRVIALTPMRAELSRALLRRGQGLLEAADRKAQLLELSTLELYYVVKELGLDAAMPLMLDAPEESLQQFCDLDCWHDDVFCPEELDAYLAAFLEQGTRELAQAFLALDSEVQVRFLQASVRIFDRREDEPPPEMPEDCPTRVTPDGFFYLANIAQEREVDPFVLVDALVAVRMDEAFRLLTAAKWELPAQLEEQALQFRQGRLSELGFCERAEAMTLFAQPSARLCALRNLPTDALEAVSDVAMPHALIPSAPKPKPLPQALPALHAHALADAKSAFGSALIESRGVDAERIGAEFVHLVHRLLVARGEGPHNMRLLNDVAAETIATLSLGLEAVVASSNEHAALVHQRLVEAWPLAELFRLGAAESKSLAKDARALVEKLPALRAWLEMPNPHETDGEADARLFMTALLAVPHAWAGKPFERGHKGGWRNFDDLAASRARLEALAEHFAGARNETPKTLH